MEIKHKGGEIITLTTGREFKLPFTPVKSTGGGGGRKWIDPETGEELTDDDHWKPLYDSLADYNTVERNEVCSGLIWVSYQKLLKSFQKTPNRVVKEDSYRKKESSGNVSALVKIGQNKAKIERKEAEIAELKAGNAELANEGIEKLRQQLAELESMTNDGANGFILMCQKGWSVMGWPFVVFSYAVKQFPDASVSNHLKDRPYGRG